MSARGVYYRAMTQTTSDQISTPAVVVGDFFHESWGYDQTNADFYEVVRVSASGKTVWLRHVDTALVSGDGPADYVAPIPGAFTERPLAGDRSGELKRLLKETTWRDEKDVYVNMTSYSHAYRWNCTPAFQTGAGYGH